MIDGVTIYADWSDYNSGSSDSSNVWASDMTAADEWIADHKKWDAWWFEEYAKYSKNIVVLAPPSHSMIQGPPQPIPKKYKVTGYGIGASIDWAKRNLLPEVREPYLQYKQGSIVSCKDGAKAGESWVPAEVRLMIWRYVLDLGHDAQISWRINNGIKSGRWPVMDGWACRGRQPNMTAVSRETRRLALKHYKMSFRSEWDVAHTYFNFDTDRLFINVRQYTLLQMSLDSILPVDAARLKRLILPIKVIIKNPSSINFSKSLCTIKGLEEAILWCGSSVEDVNFMRNPKHFEGLCERSLAYKWEDINPDTKSPKVRIQYIDALWASKLRIDGLMWG